jgi:arsenite-transporting ATPase
MGQTSWRLFAGKGGVGKTTCAAATAVDAAARGARVLVVSTDPAHSLGDALGRRLGPRPARVTLRGASGSLHACELDAPAALARWIDERRGALVAAATRGTLLDAAEAERLLRLSLPGADELVGLLEVDRLAREGRHDLVVIDAAPTGHTLRLLDAPGSLARLARVLDSLLEKDRWLAERFGRGHRRDASDALVDELEGSAAELTLRLRDPARCAVTWVLVPEDLPIAETREGVRALEAMGMAVGEVVLNRLTPGAARCAACRARGAAERESLRALVPLLAGRALRVVPALEGEPRGVEALRAIALRLRARASAARLAAPRAARAARPARAPGGTKAQAQAPAPPWLPTLAGPARRLVLFGGKGGVGKTSCAATVALALARATPAREVLLLSVDPAHSTADALDLSRVESDAGARPVPGVPRLALRELDARAAFARARERWRGALDELFEAIAGGGLDATLDRRAAEELVDLAPPGLDELLGALEVVDELLGDPVAGRPPACDLLVVDTPPTGHALRLLEAPALALEWTRACLRVLRDHGALGPLARDLTDTAARLRRLRELLEDPARTGFVVVTRAGALPIAETARLLEALARLRVPVPAVIMNDLLAPETGCARCEAEAHAQAAAVTAVTRLRREGAAGGRWAIIRAPRATPRPPRGSRALGAWGLTWQVDAEPPARRSARPRPARAAKPEARRRR